ncbi:MAG: DsbA family protein [Bryobacteraceae bacterium]|nr:DsbA family protein [Bryobacteraceae bacterium]
MKLLISVLLGGVLLAGDPLVEGNPQSTVRVVIYEDLQCSDCAVFRAMMDKHLLPMFGTRVAFEHRDFPLAKHNWARQAALVARGLGETDPKAAVRLRQFLLANMKSITLENFASRIGTWAKSQQLDGEKLLAALQDSKIAGLVEADYQEGVARGISRTPTVLVNGEPFIEAISLAEITKAIEREVGAVSR